MIVPINFNIDLLHQLKINNWVVAKHAVHYNIITTV